MLPPGANRPVFPQPLPAKGQQDSRPPEWRGVLLLDWLAAHALPATLASEQHTKHLPSGEVVTVNPSPERLAEKAYDLAEALLLERQKRLHPATSTTAPAEPA